MDDNSAPRSRGTSITFLVKRIIGKYFDGTHTQQQQVRPTVGLKSEIRINYDVQRQSNGHACFTYSIMILNKSNGIKSSMTEECLSKWHSLEPIVDIY